MTDATFLLFIKISKGKSSISSQLLRLAPVNSKFNILFNGFTYFSFDCEYQSSF